MIQNGDKVTNGTTSNEHALFAYFEMMKSLLSASAHNDTVLSVCPRLGQKIMLAKELRVKSRKRGKYCTFVGAIMTRWKMIDNIRNLLQCVIKNNVNGGYIETGVWRRGASASARDVVAECEESENGVPCVCDSFASLPPGEKMLDPQDKN